MIKNLSLIFLLILFSIIISCKKQHEEKYSQYQYPKYQSENLPFNQKWGLGVILPIKRGLELSNRNIIPATGFNIYNKPKGNVVGRIYSKIVKYKGPNKDFEIPEGAIIYTSINGDLKIPINHDEDTKQIGYSSFAIKYYKTQENFILVLFNSLKNGYWLSLDELQKIGYKIVSWKEILLNRSGLFPYPFYSGLNLRKEPKETSNKILLIKNVEESK